MGAMQMEAATFLVREKRCKPKPLGLHATRLICCGPMRHQIPRVFLACCPATEEHNRPIGGFGHACIPERAQGARLATGCHRLAPAALAVPHDRDVAARPDDVRPAILL
jgi:hypothetical protein